MTTISYVSADVILKLNSTLKPTNTNTVQRSGQAPLGWGTNVNHHRARDRSTSAISYLPPAIRYQLSATSHQPLAIR